MSHYPPAEERLNILLHAAGLLLGIVGLVALILRASAYGTIWHIVSFTIFGSSLILLYAASTIYHSTSNASRRRKMRTVDHAAIYLLIAGTYTPFTLVTLHGPVGWTLFAISWGMATIGIILKLFYTGRFDMLSTLMYVFMGWIIVFAIEPMIENLSMAGFNWLIAGGIAYTVGAILYSIKKLPYGHAAFHAFVVAGSACHFLAVYFYVLPAPISV